VLWGFTAVLGKQIALSAPVLVWWRVMLMSLSVLVFYSFQRLRRVRLGLIVQMMGIGCLIAVHWMCFYGSVKLSNASVAVVTMAFTAFFSALLEPLVMRKGVNWRELSLGVLLLPGMGLVVGNIDWSMRPGFFLGILSALLASLFTLLNKQLVDAHPLEAPVVSFWEMVGAFLISSLLIPFWLLQGVSILPVGTDWLWLLILVWACTLVPFTLSIYVMRYVSAFTANLTINLEPVYGILLAVFLFREDMVLGWGFYAGTAIILGSVLGHPFIMRSDKFN
jgi:drug/metabolite transporter (DMT)-like permease